ncbi:MAG TPA: hypothetical protein VMG10_35930 [Gemmataceae bacterium]|nr:hypothetical protein [Gemmataceae bacterium]
MERDPQPAASSLSSALRTFRRPWPILLAGLACTVFGLVLSKTPLVPLRLLLLGAGILLASIAVARRLQSTSWQHLEDRVESAALLVATAFLALLIWFNMEPSWDSGSTFLIAVIAVALVGAFLVLLPRTARRIVVVALVVFHFGGILTAVTSVPPRNEAPPWIAMQLWTRVYRHYLFFAYLTNAYHFYSPDPGPPTLLWFHVEYADGSARWIKIPSRHASPVGLYHQRMLAAAESAYNPIPGLPLGDSEAIANWEKLFKRKYELLPGIPHDTAVEMLSRRQNAYKLVPFVDPDDLDEKGQPRPAPLMMLPEDIGIQFSEPQETARWLLSSYARHIAHTSPDPNNSHNPVQAVRIYRVVHTLISPRELDEGRDPLDPTRFVPHYMGKYDLEGRLLDPKDPYLFWHVPMSVRVPARFPEPGTFDQTAAGPVMGIPRKDKPDEPMKSIDFLEIHATQSDRFQPNTAEK